MSRANPLASLVHRTAPLVAGVLLVGLMVMNETMGMISAREAVGTGRYFADIKEQIEALPYNIGGRFGKDMEVQASAQELLRPNKLLQRRYRNHSTGQAATLLIVHCGDAGDMVGHYPPNCYPANGWIRLGGGEWASEFAGREIPTWRYEFEKTSGPHTQRMDIRNFFVLPERGVVPTIDEVNRASRAAARSGLGAAQIQIMTDLDMPEDEREELVTDFMAALDPVIRTIAAGVVADDE